MAIQDSGLRGVIDDVSQQRKTAIATHEVAGAARNAATVEAWGGKEVVAKLFVDACRRGARSIAFAIDGIQVR